MLKALGWHAYRLVRPAVRPVAWRLRIFFVGKLQDELWALRGEVERLRTALERDRAVQEAADDARVRDVMAQALATLALDREGRG